VCAYTRAYLAFVFVSWTDHDTVVSFYHLVLVSLLVIATLNTDSSLNSHGVMFLGNTDMAQIFI